MSLATQCPHCKTTFRVAQDQLKLRAGLVRCGACREIFNGIEHLLPAETVPEQAPAHPAPPIKQAEQAAPPTASAMLDFVYPEFDVPETTPPESSAPHESAASTASAEPVEPAAEAAEAVDFVDMPKTEAPPPFPFETTVDATDEPMYDQPFDTPVDEAQWPGESSPIEPFLADIGEHAIDTAGAAPALEAELDNPPKPTRSKRNPYAPKPPKESLDAAPDIDRDADEPSFVKQGRRKQRLGRTIRITLLLASFLLLLGALGQGVFAFRDQIAARFPESRPALLAGCSFLHCGIGVPAQIENISIESHQLETLRGNKGNSELTMLLRNAGSTAQAWPYIELTLTDPDGALLARRVFAPRDYLSDSRAAPQGMAANSEQTVKLYIGLPDTKPAGYRVGVFYP